MPSLGARSWAEGRLEVGGYLPPPLTPCLHFCFQIRRHPSFKNFLHRLSDSSLRKLAATLQSRKAHSAGPDGHLTQGPYLFAFGSSNKFAGNNSHAVLSLMGLRYGHSYTHFPCQAASQVRTSDSRLKIPTRSPYWPLPSPAEFLTFEGLAQMPPPCGGPVRRFYTQGTILFSKTLAGFSRSLASALLGSGLWWYVHFQTDFGMEYWTGRSRSLPSCCFMGCAIWLPKFKTVIKFKR